MPIGCSTGTDPCPSGSNRYRSLARPLQISDNSLPRFRVSIHMRRDFCSWFFAKSQCLITIFPLYHPVLGSVRHGTPYSWRRRARPPFRNGGTCPGPSPRDSHRRNISPEHSHYSCFSPLSPRNTHQKSLWTNPPTVKAVTRLPNQIAQRTSGLTLQRYTPFQD